MMPARPAWIRLAPLLAFGLLLEIFLLGLTDIDNFRQEIPRFLTLYLFLFLAYLAAVRHVLGAPSDRLLGWILGFAVLFRATAIFIEPGLSDDIYRYLWDGKVLNHGINPYLYAPSAPELAPLRDALHASINHKHIGTPYGPVMIAFFAVAERLGHSVFLMKLAFLLADCLVIVLLMRLLRASSRPASHVLIYAWSPLVLVEVAGNGHNDVLAILFLLGALALLVRGSPWQAALGLALAIASKYLALLFLPVLWRRLGQTGRVILPLALATAFLPFYQAFAQHIDSLFAVGSAWRFNDSLFAIIRFLTGSDVMSRIIAATLFLLLAAFVYRREQPVLKGAMLLVGGALLLTTTLQPWYLLWIVPFLCFYPNRAWILLTGLTMLSYQVLTRYAAEGVWLESPWIKYAIYLPFFTLLLADAWNNRRLYETR